jgi:hypothetical protein
MITARLDITQIKTSQAEIVVGNYFCITQLGLKSTLFYWIKNSL